jgi:hypothetical protein
MKRPLNVATSYKGHAGKENAQSSEKHDWRWQFALKARAGYVGHDVGALNERRASRKDRNQT